MSERGTQWRTKELLKERIDEKASARATIATSFAGRYEATFTATDDFVVEHNLGGRPHITVLDSSGVEIDFDAQNVIVGKTTHLFFAGTLTSARVICQSVGASLGGRFSQTFTNTTSQVVTHNLGLRPNVRVRLSTGEEIGLNITHDSVNQVTLTFSGTLTNAVVNCFAMHPHFEQIFTGSGPQTFTHNFGVQPLVTAWDSQERRIDLDIDHTSADAVELDWAGILTQARVVIDTA